MRRILVIGLLVSGPAIAGSNPMQPGLWEFTVASEMSNLPVKIPPRTLRHCITQDDLADPKKTIPANKVCSIEDVQHSGDITTWKAICKTELGELRGAGQMRATAQSYEGAMAISTEKEGMRFDLKQTYAGKRVGADCK